MELLKTCKSTLENHRRVTKNKRYSTKSGLILSARRKHRKAENLKAWRESNKLTQRQQLELEALASQEREANQSTKHAQENNEAILPEMDLPYLQNQPVASGSGSRPQIKLEILDPDETQSSQMEQSSSSNSLNVHYPIVKLECLSEPSLRAPIIKNKRARCIATQTERFVNQSSIDLPLNVISREKTTELPKEAIDSVESWLCAPSNSHVCPVQNVDRPKEKNNTSVVTPSTSGSSKKGEVRVYKLDPVSSYLLHKSRKTYENSKLLSQTSNIVQNNKKITDSSKTINSSKETDSSKIADQSKVTDSSKITDQSKVTNSLKITKSKESNLVSPNNSSRQILLTYSKRTPTIGQPITLKEPIFLPDETDDVDDSHLNDLNVEKTQPLHDTENTYEFSQRQSKRICLDTNTVQNLPKTEESNVPKTPCLDSTSSPILQAVKIKVEDDFEVVENETESPDMFISTFNRGKISSSYLTTTTTHFQPQISAVRSPSTLWPSFTSAVTAQTVTTFAATSNNATCTSTSTTDKTCLTSTLSSSYSSSTLANSYPTLVLSNSYSLPSSVNSSFSTSSMVSNVRSTLDNSPTTSGNLSFNLTAVSNSTPTFKDLYTTLPSSSINSVNPKTTFPMLLKENDKTIMPKWILNPNSTQPQANNVKSELPTLSTDIKNTTSQINYTNLPSTLNNVNMATKSPSTMSDVNTAVKSSSTMSDMNTAVKSLDVSIALTSHNMCKVSTSHDMNIAFPTDSNKATTSHGISIASTSPHAKADVLHFTHTEKVLVLPDTNRNLTSPVAGKDKSMSDMNMSLTIPKDPADSLTTDTVLPSVLSEVNVNCNLFDESLTVTENSTNLLEEMRSRLSKTLPDKNFVKYMSDPDFYFFLSLMPLMRMLSIQEKIIARISIKKILIDMTCSSPNVAFNC